MYMRVYIHITHMHACILTFMCVYSMRVYIHMYYTCIYILIYTHTCYRYDLDDTDLDAPNQSTDNTPLRLGHLSTSLLLYKSPINYSISSNGSSKGGSTSKRQKSPVSRPRTALSHEEEMRQVLEGMKL